MRVLKYETQCARCDRKEIQTATPEELASPEPDPADSFAFYAVLGELDIRFQDLCTPCKRTIKALLEQVGKKIDGVSPDRKTEKKPARKREATEKGDAPAHRSITDGHSAAGAKATAAGVARA